MNAWINWVNNGSCPHIRLYSMVRINRPMSIWGSLAAPGPFRLPQWMDQHGYNPGTLPCTICTSVLVVIVILPYTITDTCYMLTFGHADQAWIRTLHQTLHEAIGYFRGFWALNTISVWLGGGDLLTALYMVTEEADYLHTDGFYIIYIVRNAPRHTYQNWLDCNCINLCRGYTAAKV